MFNTPRQSLFCCVDVVGRPRSARAPGSAWISRKHGPGVSSPNTPLFSYYEYTSLVMYTQMYIIYVFAYLASLYSISIYELCI